MTARPFALIDTTIERIHAAYRSGELTARALVQGYLDRIDAYDQQGPALNAFITVNRAALEDADRLDAAWRTGGPVGPLHGIVLAMKDQGDVKGMPTTMGSVIFKDHFPGRDATVVAKLRAAGAIIIGKTTLGELGAGDTHGSLFGSTRNVYDLERTAGGSSGGSAVCVSANFATAAIAQEGFSSIRRPAIWNGVAGMRPTAGLVSRGGVYAGWPSIHGSLGPMARTVGDMARLLDVMVGYDPLDPLSARGVGQTPESYTQGLDPNGLRGARLGILREPMGFKTEPGSDDFAKVDRVFNKAVEDLRAAGATVVDPIEIPELNALLAKRANLREEEDAAFAEYFAGCAKTPYATREEVMRSPEYAKVTHGVRIRWERENSHAAHHEYLIARETLMTRLLDVMADHRLDAIVHKAVEHQPTLIRDGVNPPFVDQKGAPHLNTFLVFVPSVVVPAGFTEDRLPAGITFLGRPYSDAAMLRYAHAYEQATMHRRPPACVPGV
jgi:Asp-tRNA(Asn)/Glu-tRNA(Gln) amidotransferase A subunit family amidase